MKRYLTRPKTKQVNTRTWGLMPVSGKTWQVQRLDNILHGILNFSDRVTSVTSLPNL